MGIYGMGQAFNLRYQPRPQVGMGRRPLPPAPRPMHCGGNYSETTNITIKNGPDGFWGFMGGLAQGILGSGILQRSGRPTGPSAPVQVTTPQGDGIDRLKNLQTMYSNYKVIQNDQNSFTVTDGQGKNIKTGTYEDLIKGLSTQPEGQKQDVSQKQDQDVQPKQDQDVQPKQDQDVQPHTDPQHQNGLSAEDACGLAKGTGIQFNDHATGGGQSVNGFSVDTVSTDKTSEGYPKSYTFTRAGKTITATFVKMDHGEAIYKAGNDEYRLEKVGGQIQMNQLQSDSGVLQGAGNINWTGGNFS